MPGGMLIRVRTKVGMWRVEDVNPNMTIGALKQRVLKEHNVTPHESQVFSLDPSGHRTLRDSDTIQGLGLRQGDLLHFQIREEDCAFEAGKKIAADGTIVNKTHLEASRERGFRPGMMSLRSMKMHWTLTDFVELDAQFEFKIKAQKESWCTKALMEPNAGNNFQSYMRRLGFEQCRMGFLYGSVNETNEVKVEVMYEPPQECTHEGFELLEDLRGERVEALAAALKLQKVGWIFAHPPREEGFVFSGHEVWTAAMEQLEAAQGVKETPFVTVRVSLAQEGGGDAVAHFDAFQANKQCMEMGAEGAVVPMEEPGSLAVSKQCMEMVAEGAVVPIEEPGSLAVNQTFTAIVEGKAAPKIDNNFFLVNVPIANAESEMFVTKFPRFNRADELPSQAAMKAQFAEAGRTGWTFVDLLSDFHLLLFLTDFLDMHEMSVICQSVMDRSVPLGEGHEAIIRALSGE